jgi:G3E family GTPase
MASVPITIVSGFLGAAKTTLVERLLADGRERLAVLVNDFAAINVDAALIESAAPDRIALTNGCVCCTLRADLLAAALDLASATPRPDRIVIETSGVAEPYGVMEAFLLPETRDRVFVESSVCLVDAEHFLQLDYASGELAIDQAAVSDFVLLNKCDLVPADEIERVERVLYGALPAMRIRRTTRAQVEWEILFGIRERGPRKAGRRGHADFASFAWRSEEPIDIDAFRRMVEALPRGVLRAKGILAFKDHADERAVFQLIGKRSGLAFEKTTAGTVSSLVLIGTATDFDATRVRDVVASLGGMEVEDSA